LEIDFSSFQPSFQLIENIIAGNFWECDPASRPSLPASAFKGKMRHPASSLFQLGKNGKFSQLAAPSFQPVGS